MARVVAREAPVSGTVRTLDEAAGFVNDAGLALLFPKPDLVLPSLWEAIAGSTQIEWSSRDPDGKFVEFTPEFAAIWRWKDELPARRLACAGKHVARVGALVAPSLLPALYALTGRSGRPDDFRDDDDLTALQRDVAEVVLEAGPCTRPEVRELLGTTERARVETAIDALQRRLVLTNVGLVEQEHGWPAIKLDLLARHWRSSLRKLPDPDAARETLVERVVRAAGDVSAVDLAAALAWRRREATAVLERLEERGSLTASDEDGIRIWTARR